MKQPKLIVITGPTASGKSALAVSLAKRLNTEIISADSRQIYKGIPIVTAVPTEEEKQGIPHHLLEILPLEAYYSAAKFQEDTEKILDNIFHNNEYAIICGGSMLYIDALIKGIDELPTVPENVRLKLMKEWHDRGDQWLLDSLQTLDSKYYQIADLKNLKRIFHAVEVSITAGKPYSSLLSGNKADRQRDLSYDVVKFCVSGSRDELFNRINRRVLKMMDSGLEDEAREVYPLRNLNSLNTVGLKEMFKMFEGVLSREEAIGRIQKNTRVYAKKQLTWHKRDNNLLYIDFGNPQEENVEYILNILNKNK